MLIECHDLNYRYPSSQAMIFRNLSCQISGSGFHALFGPSGAGKTTLAKMIAGLVDGFSGEIKVYPDNGILYTYNLERLPGWSPVEDHLTAITPVKKLPYLQKLAKSFGISKCLETRFSKLSLGQQNRTNLTRYLLQDFNLLIMDESLANVDEATRDSIILRIKELFPQKTFLYISHNVMEVAKFCNTILVLRGVNKSPQVTSIKGQNHNGKDILDQRRLEQTMLEIVHAS
ncbi:MAG: ATP-binding cassette domain-containing protein [Desulfobacterales bacterium]